MHISICLLLTVENTIWVRVGIPRVAVPIPPEGEWARRVLGEEREEDVCVGRGEDMVHDGSSCTAQHANLISCLTRCVYIEFISLIQDLLMQRNLTPIPV